MIILLVMIGIIVLVGIIALSVLLVQGGSGGGVFNKPCSEISTSSLVNAQGMPCVIGTGGAVTSDKLSVGYQPLAILTPNEYPYKTACATLCSRVNDGHCVTSSGEIDPLNDPTYQACLKNLEPQNCIGTAMPVAYSGNTLYYVKSFYTVDVRTGTCT